MIYVDADACPVKAEVMKVALRHHLHVVFVANSHMNLPSEWDAELIVVDRQLDAADDWIVEKIRPGDIVVTSDIPLADRVIQLSARVLTPHGKVYDYENIGHVRASRDLMQSLRESGEITGGPPPFKKEDRSLFLQELEKVIQKVKRNQ